MKDAPEHEHDSAAWNKHRARFVPKRLKILGHPFSAWAKCICAQDAARIHTAISVALTNGLENTDVAHSVIGSRRLNGADGVTETTRQHLRLLGKGYLQKLKRQRA